MASNIDRLMAAGAEVFWTVKVYGVPELTVQTTNAEARALRAELAEKGIPAKLAIFYEEFFTLGLDEEIAA